MEFSLRRVATVRASRAQLEDDGWDEVSATIELADDVPDESLLGLDEFSHVEVVLLAHRARDVPPAPWRRRPRGNPQWPEVGVFAQRNKDRPNRLLVSVAEILEVGPRSLSVRGLDAVDGTPVLDIKPVFRWSGARGALRAPVWSDEIGRGYF
jgi:tRNA (Thr-GGU) A37 N-methylase